MNVVGLVVAVLSAVGFAISTSLQHHANETLSAAHVRTGRRVPLLRRPCWVVGQAVGLAAFALHAWALRLGLLIVVQPIVVSGIVLAVPVRAALEHRLPALREVGTVALTAAGLSLLLVAVHPSSVRSDRPTMSVAVAATSVSVGAALVAGRWARGRAGVAQASAYGVASGVLFGLTAGLLKLAAATSAAAGGGSAGFTALLTAWPTWAVPVVGICGVALNQRAYRAAPLSASMPLLNIVDVLVAIGFGVLVFGEVPAHGPLDLTGQAVGIALMLFGLRRLARSPAAEAGPVAVLPAPVEQPYARSTS